jgi:hypothetical protein
MPKCPLSERDCDWAMYGIGGLAVEELACRRMGPGKARCRFTIARNQAAAGWRRCRAVFVVRRVEDDVVWDIARDEGGAPDRPQIKCH